jgi:phosphotransferase system  glucose/maltose/N-acetylglucosamine-specific IIC component
MENNFINFINNATVFQKGVFLMVIGIAFVFAVQMVFYLTVKLWQLKKPAAKE